MRPLPDRPTLRPKCSAESVRGYRVQRIRPLFSVPLVRARAISRLLDAAHQVDVAPVFPTEIIKSSSCAICVSRSRKMSPRNARPTRLASSEDSHDRFPDPALESDQSESVEYRFGRDLPREERAEDVAGTGCGISVVVTNLNFG